eukprot:9037417-Pyramimonas_sp.AAC.2
MGASLAFKNLSFAVKLSTGVTKKILADVSGLIEGTKQSRGRLFVMVVRTYLLYLCVCYYASTETCDSELAKLSSTAGNMMFMMGPSGAGKSSLLDALADRVKSPVTGEVYVNKELKDALSFNKIAKVVSLAKNTYHPLYACAQLYVLGVQCMLCAKPSNPPTWCHPSFVTRNDE